MACELTQVDRTEAISRPEIVDSTGGAVCSGRPSCGPGVSWRPWQAGTATRRPGREGSAGKVKGSARTQDFRDGSLRVGNATGELTLPWQGQLTHRGSGAPIGDQKSTTRSRRMRKAGGTVTSHGCSSRTTRLRDALRGEFALGHNSRGQVRTHSAAAAPVPFASP